MSERDAFGPSLKAERDRRGITLQAIADSTKIATSLLAALERNDFSRWPKGIFRRAFLREYVVALGLPPEPIVAEFVRLFPDGTGSPELPEMPPTPELPPELRLTLDGECSASWSTIRARVVAAAVEVGGVVTIGSAFGWILGVSLWSAIAVLALTYYSLAAVVIERTPYPHLILPATRPRRWLETAARTIRSSQVAWRKPTESAGGTVANEEMEGQTSNTPEWGTASN